MANLNKTKLSQQQLLQRTFEENADRLRVSVGDSDDTLAVNSNGSINTILQDLNGDPYSISNPLPVNAVIDQGKPSSTYYDEVTGVVSGITTLIITMTAVVDQFLQKVDVSGTNIAEYEVVVDSQTLDKKRTYFAGGLNATFDLGNIEILTGSTVEIYVLHTRPSVGDFNARLQFKEL